MSPVSLDTCHILSSPANTCFHAASNQVIPGAAYTLTSYHMQVYHSTLQPLPYSTHPIPPELNLLSHLTTWKSGKSTSPKHEKTTANHSPLAHMQHVGTPTSSTPCNAQPPRVPPYHLHNPSSPPMENTTAQSPTPTRSAPGREYLDDHRTTQVNSPCPESTVHNESLSQWRPRYRILYLNSYNTQIYDSCVIQCYRYPLGKVSRRTLLVLPMTPKRRLPNAGGSYYFIHAIEAIKK